jgi:microsomal dipeptidase-like Zn-dependent dipeptidase
MAEYDRDDPNTLHAILILEGSQNLFNNPDDADSKLHFIENLNKLHNQFRIFAINVCHFQQQPIANHAFAMLFLKNEPFFPIDSGITEWGFEAIREIYRRKILIDTKHMGLHARQELYRMRQEEGISLPLICSHAGVTGISAMDRLKYIGVDAPGDAGSVWKIKFLKKWGHVKDTVYNMASLQLYDEDIEEIIISGGMIGISLDQRIIGFPSDGFNVGVPPTDPDFISKKETNAFFGAQDPRTIAPRAEDNDEIMFADDGENQNTGFPAEMHALYFLNQVLHILFVAKKSKRGIKLADGLRSICIGSDFDGLVNPLDCCSSTAEYPDFKKQLFDLMDKKSFWRGTGFSFGELDIADLLDRLFFNNAENFLKENYK